MASRDDERQSAPTDLFGSLKIVSGAAQSTFNKQTDKVNYGEVAGAASNLLGAASQYGNLDNQQGLGKYVDQAQDYLHKYHQSSQSGTRPPQDTATDEPVRTESPPVVDEPEAKAKPKEEYDDTPTPAAAAVADDYDEGAKPRKTTPTEEDEEEKVDVEPERKDEQEAEGGQLGDYAKVAQGFLGKGNEEEGSGGGLSGAGDYVKLAQGFLGKSDEEEGSGGGEAGVGGYMNMAKGLFGK